MYLFQVKNNASNPQHSPQVCHTTSSGIRFSTGSPPELPHHCTLPFSQTENDLSVPKETRPLLQSKRRNIQSQAFLRFTDTTQFLTSTITWMQTHWSGKYGHIHTFSTHILMRKAFTVFHFRHIKGNNFCKHS